MAVFVDNMKAPFRAVPWGRTMKMCHMIADTPEELREMAHKIGVQQKWIQYAGSPREHFDICLSKRKLAIALGAKEITSKELVKMTALRKKIAEKKSDFP